MACIEHYIRDAEILFSEIEKCHTNAQHNVFKEYKAARTIQRYFRGYITRKHIKYIHSLATIIQKHWRGYVARKYYFQLLKEAVYKMYVDHYNNSATRIQKVWRGHYVRSRVFSYYKLKEYIKTILEKNNAFLEYSKTYKNHTQRLEEMEMQQECKDWLTYISSRAHHLLRTHQIEGVYSKHGQLDYSVIEKYLKNGNFADFMNKRHALDHEKQTKEHQENYIFEGRLRECEEVWLHRNDPGKYSLATGEYVENNRSCRQEPHTRQGLSDFYHRPMCFGRVHHNEPDKLDNHQYQCPPLHKTTKQVQ